uniref:Uncharacterized protein n=1 Tax=Oryza nivara TaxID=4536 RepID=A0A0E0G0F3_ORYNI
MWAHTRVGPTCSGLRHKCASASIARRPIAGVPPRCTTSFVLRILRSPPCPPALLTHTSLDYLLRLQGTSNESTTLL